MTKIICPKCNTGAYDDTSLFCHKCGAQLSVDIPEKKKAGIFSYGVKILKKDSLKARDDSLASRKRRSITGISPVEVCANCGAPIIDKNRVFCAECSANVRETPSGEATVIQPDGSIFLDKKPVITPRIYQNTETRALKEQEPVLVQKTRKPAILTAPKWKLLTILAGLAIFFFMLILIVMLMLTFWVSLY